MSHYDCKECHQDPVSGHAPDCSRGKAKNNLITNPSPAYVKSLYAEIKDTSDLTSIASARIKGDKDWATRSSAPNEETHLRAALEWIADAGYVDHQSGNANFEYLQSVARDALGAALGADHDRTA